MDNHTNEVVNPSVPTSSSKKARTAQSTEDERITEHDSEDDLGDDTEDDLEKDFEDDFENDFENDFEDDLPNDSDDDFDDTSEDEPDTLVSNSLDPKGLSKEAKDGHETFPDRFDLYDPMESNILVKVYGSKVKPDQAPMYEATYLETIRWQTEHPGDPSAHLDLDAAEFHWPSCAEPYGSEPYRIDVSAISRNVDVTLGKSERQYPTKSETTAQGLQVKLKIARDGCFPDRGKGLIKIQKAWQGEEATQAVYECWVELDVKYSSMLREKGHGPGQSYGAAFWAVARAEIECD